MAQLKKLALLVVLLAIPALLFAQAQDQGAAQQPAQTAQAGQQAAGGMNLRLSEAIGIALKNEAGDIQGTLNDLVVTPQGDIPYAVVTFSAPADVATQDQYLVPVDKISVASTGMQAALNLSAADIQGLQKLESGQLPVGLSMAGAAAAGAPAAPPPAAGAESANYFLATKLQGIAVMGAQEQELGTVQDAMMDLSAKKIAYVALAPAGVLGLGEKMFAVPVDQISNIDVNQGRMMVNISQDQLKANPGFTQDNWPTQASTEWGSGAATQQ